MWVFKYGNEQEGTQKIKCFLSFDDVYTNFIDNVPYCFGIQKLSCIDAWVQPNEKNPEEQIIIFSTTRNILDFPKRDSILRQILYIAAKANSTECFMHDWALVPKSPIHKQYWPGVKELKYVIIDTDLNGQFNPIDGRIPEHKILGEIHVLENDRQYFVPRFVFIDTEKDQIKLNEIQYTQYESEERNLLQTLCVIDDPRTQKRVSITIEHPLCNGTEIKKLQ